MVKKLKAVFISLSLLSGFVVADINDDIPSLFSIR